MSDTNIDLSTLDDDAFMSTNTTETTSGQASVVQTDSEIESNTSSNDESNSEQPYAESSEKSNDGVSSEGDVDDGLQLPEDFDYKSAYLNLHKPIKADGKVVSIKGDDELLSLVQKGINYTSKSQKLSEQAKLAQMLENGGVSKDDLPLLIDLHRRNPTAIQKYLQDAKVDPLDVDFDSPASYVPTSYESDPKEVTFREVVTDISSKTSGSEFIGQVTKWDEPTKAQIWDEPNLLPILHEQYASGVYTKITEEMNRLKLVGKLEHNIPFLTAYQSVGQAMLRQANLGSDDSNESNVIGKRVVEPRSSVSNGHKVTRAGNSSKRQVPPNADLSRLSDKDIMNLNI